MSDAPKDLYKPEQHADKTSAAVLILTADKTEDLEFFYPYYRFVEAGYRVDVVTPQGGEFRGKQGLGLQETKKITDVNPDDYALLYLPGGKAPAELKSNVDALTLTRRFALSQKPIAAICHGPQILAAAKLLDGKSIAAFPEVKNEIVEAGGTFVDKATVVDGNLITARWPADLPSHMKATLEKLSNIAKRAPKSVAA